MTRRPISADLHPHAEYVDCRACGENRQNWMFGCCRQCAVAGKTRALVLAEIRSKLKQGERDGRDHSGTG